LSINERETKPIEGEDKGEGESKAIVKGYGSNSSWPVLSKRNVFFSGRTSRMTLLLDIGPVVEDEVERNETT